ncbi:MAG: tRNA preQ1(34) S-adenosylmethionine ribosyltransferase-isomerase QueA [Acidobacteriota bacterium]
MLTSDFDFELPEAQIAQEALPRGDSRLLVLDAEADGRHRRVSDLGELLRPGDLLVTNDTRVVPARLFGRRAGGGRSELLLVERIAPTRWRALGRPAKKLRPGTFLDVEPPERGVRAQVIGRLDGGQIVVDFGQPVEPHLDAVGHVPLPPYIRRRDDADDRERYQTVYARADGAVAAPTAGLHFTDAMLDELEARGVERTALTLHVGIGTFKPVSVDQVSEHRMDEERYIVPPDAAAAVRRTRERGGRVIAVGTTVVRTLESVARADGTVDAGAGRTRLFITPGFRYRAVDVLLTNFHLPRSTLLMLVSAFGGRERVLAAYREAVDAGYRFYSYGDAMLLERRGS